jgi:hypothetical protein
LGRRLITPMWWADEGSHHQHIGYNKGEPMRELMCNVCGVKAVTSHGVTITTHGYCEEHRCCAECGLQINYGCKCAKPTEREDYLKYKSNL